MVPSPNLEAGTNQEKHIPLNKQSIIQKPIICFLNFQSFWINTLDVELFWDADGSTAWGFRRVWVPS